tara:strand:+ start:2647 stop:3318 length:672 start_codon:yes stop_codon:yes gene_type:complete
MADLKEQIITALGLNKTKELKLEWQSKTADGTILVSTADTLEAGVDISVLTEDGTTIPLPVGSYQTEDGLSFTVEEEGIVGELSETEEEEEVVEEEVEAAEDDGKEADVEDWAGMEKRIQNLEDAVASLKGEEEKTEEEVEELTVEPSDKPKTITTKEVKEFSVDEQLETLKAENEKLKMELAESPADVPVEPKKFTDKTIRLSNKKYENMSSSDKFLYDISK